MSDSERYSHPEEDGEEPVLLRSHLDDAATRVGWVVPETATTPAGEPFDAVARKVAFVHDAGKMTTWFQQHIGMRPGQPPERTLSHHSLFGGLIAYYVLDCSGYSDETCLAGFVAVARHHGRLRDTAEYVYERTTWSNNDADNAEQDAIIRQVGNVTDHASDEAEALVRTATDGAGSWTEFATLVESRSLFETIREHVVLPFGVTDELDPEALSNEFYGLVLRLWSTLTLVDKTSAAGTPTAASTYDGRTTPVDTVEAYVESLQNEPSDDERVSSLNDWRAAARRDVLSNLSADIDVATITLPTGLGKTLTGTNAALQLREMTGRDRVVYALPFTSIIDQVGEELMEVFGSDARDGRLLFDHHLADTSVALDDEENDLRTDRQARLETMLGKSWRSSLVLTTFVQLFESLAGPKNMQSMKLPALTNSVVVLDEPQSLPHSWWPLVRRLVRILTEEYDAAVLAMTATQPRLFTKDVPELVEDQQRYFDEIRRVEYVLDGSMERFSTGDALDYETAAAAILKEGSSTLAVCNTIDSAQQLTQAISDATQTVAVGSVHAQALRTDNDVAPSEMAEQVSRREGRPVLHLSTRLRPRDRMVLINTAKQLTERGIPVVVVSTQLIEAGVDISFERVYRDLAPMDSIVQAAGRCNRSFEREQGRVTLWWLAPPSDQTLTPSEAVYEAWGDSLLSLTVEALDDVRDGATAIPEPTLAWDGVRTYYERVAATEPGQEGWADYVDDGKAEQLGGLSLIDQRRAIDVVVCRTDDDRALVREIEMAFDKFAFDRLDSLMDDIGPIQVSIPIYPDSEQEARAIENLRLLLDEETSSTRVLDVDEGRYETYFDPVSGLVLEDSVEARFL